MRQLTIEEFLEFLASSDDEVEESPTETLSAEELLLSRAVTAAVASNRAELILHTLEVASELSIAIILEPVCKNMLRTSSVTIDC